jgi:phage terminase large subunit-like protein
MDELCAFPKGTVDDQVDGASGAFNHLAGKSVPAVAPVMLVSPSIVANA